MSLVGFVGGLLAMLVLASPDAAASTAPADGRDEPLTSQPVPPLENPAVRPSRGEILVDADAAPRPTDVTPRTVHGEARLGMSFGAVMQDPVLTIHPGLTLDLSERVPVRFSISAPLRLRMADRAPDQDGVLRARDWDEAGDYLAVLDRFHYGEAFVFGDYGWVDVEVRAGELSRMQLGHGSIVRGYANSTDIDRRRTGLDALARVEGRLRGQPAGAEFAVIAGDLAMRQPLGTRGAVDWAGVGLGLSLVGDPTAPRALARDSDRPDAVVRAAAGRLRHEGQRGALALGADLSYRVSDNWRYIVVPYLDAVFMPGLGAGGHLGTDVEFMLGRRRRVRLSAVAELTLGSASYDPDYFDLFYLAQRWQMQPVGTPDQRPDTLGDARLPKWAWVADNDLSGVGGGGSVRFSHGVGVFVETGYRVRPGPLGHTFESRVGVDHRSVSLSILLGHRGTRHGFDGARSGTIARVDARVPIIKYLEIIGGVGWLFALRTDTSLEPPAASETGLVTGAGFFTVGAAGRFPW
ncbi:MAG: hypothetical protein JKY37_10380 [Nannocystaceae bacterium]|nr:hypothetical protein [Nannocystaceae bacterium]